MKTLNFKVPFSGFCSTTFINCFASVYMYLEGMEGINESATFCNEWANGQCNGCGNCATKPQTLQEHFFFLFDTMCGHSSLRCRYNGQPTVMEALINGEGDFYDGGSKDNINFLFGFAGYDYRTVTDVTLMKNEIAASIESGKPVIVRLKNNVVPFAVVIGYNDDALICPKFRAAQKVPVPEVSYDGIVELYIIEKKIKPRYTIVDGLNRIESVMEYSLTEDLWESYMKKFDTYGSGSLSEDKQEGRKQRMQRLTATMWHTFNCYNFAEVFRIYIDENKPRQIYECVGDINILGNQSFAEILQTISLRYGYTHDLAWSLIGLGECINWDDWKSQYYGEPIKLVISKIKENDEVVLECIKKLITMLGGIEAEEDL